MKEYVAEVIRCGQAHPLLIANFDQVWTTIYEPASRVVWKDPARRGSTQDDRLGNGRFYRRQQLSMQLRIDLGLEQAAVKAASSERRKVDDGYSQVGCVGNWRVPRTTTTLSWRNGDLGRLFTTIADDKITDAQLAAAEDLRGYCVVERAGGSTHMWKGETTLRYLKFLAAELESRRHKLGVGWKDGALVIADDASVHSDHRFVELRRLWEQEHNCILLGCDRRHPIQVPGGFGSAGAPNDQWHQFWRLLRKAWLRKAIGGTNNPAYGRTYEEAQFDLRGEANIQCPLMVSLHADIYALKALGSHRSGNIIMSAWHRLGYIDAQELADIKFGGELPVLEEHLAHVPRSMALLVNLDRLPNLGLAEAASELDSQSMSIALAGQKHVWWHHDASECCRPLPQAVNGPWSYASKPGSRSIKRGSGALPTVATKA